MSAILKTSSSGTHSMRTQADVEHALGIAGFNWQVINAVAQPLKDLLYDALYDNRDSLNTILGNLQNNQRHNRFREIILGVKVNASIETARLSRMLILREALGVAILQVPDLPAGNDNNWADFAACVDGPARKHHALLAQLGPVYNWAAIAGQEKHNAEPLRIFKRTFQRLDADDLPTAFDVIAYFYHRLNGAAPAFKQYVTELRLPDWVQVWRVSPPGKKPIDVSFNKEKLRPHFEKHVCHKSADANHPAEECVAWMQVLKYDDRITLDYLRTLGIRPSDADSQIMFPADAPQVGVKTVAKDAAVTKTATVRRLAATDAARLCFVTNYLCASEQLIDVLWRDFGTRYERIARDTLNACADGFLYFETASQKVFFVGSTGAKVGDYQFLVMARFDKEDVNDQLPKWTFSTLYMPRLGDCTQTLQGFRANHVWDGKVNPGH